MKKGNKSWRPQQKLALREKEGYKRHWAEKDPMRLQELEDEGWTVISKTEHEHPGGVSDGTPLASIAEYKELVGVEMPQDLYDSRQEFFQERTDRKTKALMREAKKELRDHGAEPHFDDDSDGHIVIS